MPNSEHNSARNLQERRAAIDGVLKSLDVGATQQREPSPRPHPVSDYIPMNQTGYVDELCEDLKRQIAPVLNGGER
jgi:hypothetical protein